MADRSTPRVIGADTIGDDVIITFSNGVSALYRAELLFSIIDQAIKLSPEPWPELVFSPRTNDPIPEAS